MARDEGESNERMNPSWGRVSCEGEGEEMVIEERIRVGGGWSGKGEERICEEQMTIEGRFLPGGQREGVNESGVKGKEGRITPG